MNRTDFCCFLIVYMLSTLKCMNGGSHIKKPFSLIFSQIQYRHDDRVDEDSNMLTMNKTNPVNIQIELNITHRSTYNR